VSLDVLVAGGGPVGLAAAIEARLAGLSVVVVEPRTGVIDKACGEGLMPPAVAALLRLGVDPPGQDLAGVAYVAPSRRVEHVFRTGPGRGVRRTTLHESLLGRAEQVGVVRVAGRVEGVEQDGAGVRAAGLRARWLVAADGLHSPVRRHLGLDRPVTRHRRYGLRRHVRVAPWTDRVEVHWTPDGEIYVTPVAPDCVGLAVLGERGVGFDAVLAQAPELAARVEGAAAGPLRGAGPLRPGRVLLVGDAAGYVDALTGEGVRLGLATARAAVECLVAGTPQAYPRRWASASRELRWLTAGLVVATRRAPARRLLVPAAARLPWVFDAAVERLAA
jgi:flavin-dependent dehydrogenase